MLADGRRVEESRIRCANELIIQSGDGSRRSLPCVCEDRHVGACTFEPAESGVATGMTLVLSDGYLAAMDVGPSQRIAVRDGETLSITLGTYLE
jgi:hypothetical protein